MSVYPALGRRGERNTWIYRGYRAPLKPVLAALACLAALQAISYFSSPLYVVAGIAGYAPLHTSLEAIAILISALVFAVGWGVHDEDHPGNLTLLACVFLGVALLDYMHALSFPGMPDFVTANNPEKAINFWLLSRLLAVLGLLAVALLPWRPLRSPWLRWAILAAVLSLAGAAGWVGVVHEDWLPRTFVPGQGLTPFKIRCEYALVALYAAAALGFLRQMRKPQPYDVVSLFGATSVMALGEVFFILYSDVSDLFNFLGHVYKAIAHGFIYQGVFIVGVRAPYQRLRESRNLLQTVLDTIPLRVFWKDRESRYLGCNAIFARDAGAAGPSEVIGKLDRQLAWRGKAELLRADDRAVMESRRPRLGYEESLNTAEGKHVWLSTSKVPLQDLHGEIIGVLGVYDDITERKLAEESTRLAALVYQSSSEAMTVTDADNTFISVNPAFTALTGYTLSEVVGRNPHILSSGYHDQAFYDAMWHALDTTGHWQGEIWDRRKNGELYAKWLTVNTIYNDDGSVHRRVALFSDITGIKRANELLWRQANFDALTGLPNRSMFRDRLFEEIKKARRAGLPMALMLIDLDSFKEVNDTLGHDKGDMLLKEASRRLSGCVRESDLVARLGGDEFTVILSQLEDAACVERVALDILRQLSDPISLGSETAYVSASIGITLYPDDATEVDTLLKNADQAMYAAKNQGRSRYSYFSPSMQEAAQARMRLVNDLRGAWPAINSACITSIVQLATGAIHKAEALIRWQHPVRGLVNPAEFIPIAEDTGMIVDIGNWVFREAARQAARWRALHHAEFQISVNKSPVQFHRVGHDYAAWLAYLQELGLPGQNVVVEITEGLLMDNSSAVTGQLLAFRDAGIQVALDDFGTGYSALSYLQKFDIDYLKIDRAFVHDLAPDSSNTALCEAIIVMAHKLGIKVVAEGVETEQQRSLLAAAGCDYGQGYLFSRPVPADEFEALLQLSP
ncbi:bifunctional diguanylate cyclase/phosphodiesterase [Methylogaea oryzae]|uniref:bifunctional diguanylate cyclase/phosphodiesterase n=1 Tax=Methylogaea oryzae TaxID=1295382 RepID=UPI0006CFCB08|nr:EAL domain-containing protein [Methylogaea oryzae]